MLKFFVTVVISIYATAAHAQVCKCDIDTLLNEVVPCFTIHFKNNTKLYRQFNCDSSWLTFESSAGKKEVLYSLDDGLIEYTEKLGYQYAAEYKSTFLIQNNLISGCCTPPGYLLFNKANGNKIKNLGSLIFYSENRKYPFVVYIEKKMMNSLRFYDIDRKKTFSVSLPQNKISNTLQKGDLIYAEYLFEEPVMSKNRFSIALRYQNPGNNNDWYNYKIIVDLKNSGINKTLFCTQS
jgi:hypothetical protein